MKRDYLLNAGADGRKELPIALFDFDWTIVKPREGRRFPLEVADWTWLTGAVPDRIRAIAQSHRIVIITDQTKFWKLHQIQSVIDALGVPITAIVGGVTKKPETTWLLAALGPDDATRISFYVGDAAGRPGDWSDADKMLAERMGLPFHVADEFWAVGVDPTLRTRIIPPATGREVVIMVGYPASGKTTLANDLVSRGYHRVDGDALATATAMIRDAAKHPGNSIVFDSTAGTMARRSQFIAWAAGQGLPVRIVWVQTAIEDAMSWNARRAAPVPAVAFYAYRKRFEPPTEAEGATIVCVE